MALVTSGGASQDLNSMASCPQLVTAMLDAASSSSSLWVIVTVTATVVGMMMTWMMTTAERPRG